MHDLKVWPNVEADGSASTVTPGKDAADKEQMARLVKVGMYDFPYLPLI